MNVFLVVARVTIRFGASVGAATIPGTTTALAFDVIAPLQILLVEDDPATSFVTKRALRACADVAVTVARDGADALEQLSASGLPLDRTIVVTDLDMPR